MLDPFRDGFSLTQLTQAINILPNMYRRISGSGLFTWRPQTGRVATLEMRNGVLGLVKTTPWGGVPPKNTRDTRNIRSFTIPHMPFEDTVAASDVVGVREFGTDNQLSAVSTKVNEVLQQMKNKIDQTMEYRRFSALKGYVLDADGTIMEDYFAAFGVARKVINFELDNANTDVRSKAVELVRWLEDYAFGEQFGSIKAEVSPEFFDALITHKYVKDMYLGWAEAANKLGNDLRQGFSIGGVSFHEYRAQVNGQRFIDAGQGHAYPLGTTEMFSDYGAPADFIETVNTIALPYYSRQQNKDFNRGIDLHVQSNILPMVSRPNLLITLAMNTATMPT